MNFIDHIEELRGALLKALLGLGAGFAVSFFFISVFFKILTKPYLDLLVSLNVPLTSALRSLSPGDTFQMSMQAAFLVGLALALPWITYQLWRFVSPALYTHERRYVLIFSGSAFAFFLIGMAFCYFVVLPAAISFFYNYTVEMGIAPDWTISNYFDFVVTFLACFGVVFELPVAMAVLTWLGIASPEIFAKYRRHAIVIIFIIAAIFTPPDVASQLMMGVPMVILYELSIFASRFVKVRADRERLPEPPQEEGL